ncbi:MAG TPA: heparin lyase I family protein, partial [Gemmatimonadales bacterium]
ISPKTVSLDVGEVFQFSAVSGPDSAVTWSTTGGAITPSGWFRAPGEAGTYLVALHQPNGQSDTAVVTVQEPVAPYFSDSFESCQLSHADSTGFGWAESRGTPSDQPVVSNLIARSGVCSLKFTFPAGGPGADGWSEQRFVFGKKLSEVYLGWHQYFPTGLEVPAIGPKFKHRNDPSGPDNNKLLRLWGEDYTDYDVKAGFSMLPRGGLDEDSQLNTEYMRRGATGSKMAVANIGPWTKVVGSDTRGRWVKFLVRMKLAASPTANDGVLQLWLDDVLVADYSSLPLYSSRNGAKNYIRHGYLMGWANSGFTERSTTYIDDVVISRRSDPLGFVNGPHDDVTSSPLQ